MTSTICVGRDHWLGYRWQRHGLGGKCSDDLLDDVLMLGLQGSRQSGGEQSLSQRTSRIGSTSVRDAIQPDGPLVTMWSVRGAPHAHRASQVDFVRDALAPLGSDDGGQEYVEAVEEVAVALKKVVARATPKGEASREVADQVSKSLVQWCLRCKTNHVSDGTFRAGGRKAQVVIGPEEQRATMLYLCPRVRQDQVARPRLALAQAYFRVNGPTSKTLFRDWMEGGTTGTNELWDELGDDLVRVQVGKNRYDLPAPLADAVSKAPKAKGVALVPPNDPYLRQVDRALLVPDSTRRQRVYKALSGPGALLVDGEVAGTWRYRRSDHEVTIEPFGPMEWTQKTASEKSARAVATSTGDDAPSVNWS